MRTKHGRRKTDLKPPCLKKEKEEKIAKSVQFVAESEGQGQERSGGTRKSECSHLSGQELCYLCHQRQKRNIPISFEEETVSFGCSILQLTTSSSSQI